MASSLSLTLEQSLGLATKEAVRGDVRVLGALSAAAILTHNHRAEFDPDMLSTILTLVDGLLEILERDEPMTTPTNRDDELGRFGRSR
nr:hypothetical protein [uncultured Pseudomonas sp.]